MATSSGWGVDSVEIAATSQGRQYSGDGGLVGCLDSSFAILSPFSVLNAVSLSYCLVFSMQVCLLNI
jgi:hypothetical protein